MVYKLFFWRLETVESVQCVLKNYKILLRKCFLFNFNPTLNVILADSTRDHHTVGATERTLCLLYLVGHIYRDVTQLI